MKKFLPGLGGHPIKNDDARLMQDAYLLGFQALAGYLSNSQNVILNGIVVTNNGTTVTNTAGYAIWLGEIYVVAAGSFPVISGGQYFFKLNQNTIAPSPTEYKDGSIQNVHIDRQLILEYYNSGDQGEYYSNFTRVSTGAVPSGTLLDWFGNVNASFDNTGAGINALAGYQICNGLGGAPDLRGLFIVAATNVPNSGAPALNPLVGTYNLTDAGGLKSNTLTKAQMPSYNLTVNDVGHTHNQIRGDAYTGSSQSAQNVVGGGQSSNLQPDSISKPSTTGITVSSGGSGAIVENRPPYYASVKIMKL